MPSVTSLDTFLLRVKVRVASRFSSNSVAETLTMATSSMLMPMLTGAEDATTAFSTLAMEMATVLSPSEASSSSMAIGMVFFNAPASMTYSIGKSTASASMPVTSKVTLTSLWMKWESSSTTFALSWVKVETGEERVTVGTASSA